MPRAERSSVMAALRLKFSFEVAIAKFGREAFA
jgi:hypothetical protein